MIKKIICFFCIFFCLVSLNSFAISTPTDSNLNSKNQSVLDIKSLSKKVDRLRNQSVYIKTEKTFYLADSIGILKIDSLSHSYIDDHYFDRAGVKPDLIYAETSQVLYVGTDKGIYIGTKQPAGNYVFEHVNAFGLEDISALYVDSQKTIFAGTQGDGLKIGKHEGQSASDYTISNYLPSDCIQHIYGSTTGTLFVEANDQNLESSHILWVKEQEKEYLLSLPNDALITTIDDSSNGILKIGTVNGLFVGKKDIKGFYTTLIPQMIYSDKNENVDAAVYITSKGIMALTSQGLFAVKAENGRYMITDRLNMHRLAPINSQRHREEYEGTQYYNSGDFAFIGIVVCTAALIAMCCYLGPYAALGAVDGDTLAWAATGATAGVILS